MAWPAASTRKLVLGRAVPFLILLCALALRVHALGRFSLGLFFLVAGLAALEAYRRRPARALYAAWFLAILAAAYTLYFAGLVAALASLLLIVAYRRNGLQVPWRLLPWSGLAWAILYLPWLPYVVSVARRAPPLEPEALNREWIRYRVQVLGTGDWLVEPVSPGSWAFWLLVAVGLALCWRARPAVACSLWGLLGAAIQIAVLQFRPHYPAVRHLMPSWFAAVLIAGYGAAQLWRRAAGKAIAAVAVTLVLWADVRTLRDYYDHGRPRWNDVAIYLRDRVAAGDRVFAANGWVFRNLGYYWEGAKRGGPDVPLERTGDTVSGPAWLVLAVCPTTMEVRQRLDKLPLAGAFPTTNHCEIRFLPEGTTLPLPGGVCERDV